MKEFVVDLRKRLRGVWTVDALAEHGEHTNKLATGKYHHWMALPLRPLSVHGAPFSVPIYLYLDLGKHMLRNTARFRLHAHTLRVESSLWQEHMSECDRCDQGGLQDEKHLEQLSRPSSLSTWLKCATSLNGNTQPVGSASLISSRTSIFREQRFSVKHASVVLYTRGEEQVQGGREIFDNIYLLFKGQSFQTLLVEGNADLNLSSGLSVLSVAGFTNTQENSKQCNSSTLKISCRGLLVLHAVAERPLAAFLA
eukprot:1143889-Pelagomonas_calceolata.AAC.1